MYASEKIQHPKRTQKRNKKQTEKKQPQVNHKLRLVHFVVSIKTKLEYSSYGK